MATQPTNLPVPSESPRDLKFNAGKIDEFVTSLVNTYVDRFGNEHYTIEGLRWLAQQAIAQYGWIPVDSFQDGADITLPNQALRDEATGEYYRWDGALPKHVDAGSTPDTSGGVGPGKWLSIGDSLLRSALINKVIDGNNKAYGTLYRTLKYFGAAGDGVTDDTAALLAADAYSISSGEPIRVTNGVYKILNASVGGRYIGDASAVFYGEIGALDNVVIAKTGLELNNIEIRKKQTAWALHGAYGNCIRIGNYEQPADGSTPVSNVKMESVVLSATQTAYTNQGMEILGDAWDITLINCRAIGPVGAALIAHWGGDVGATGDSTDVTYSFHPHGIFMQNFRCEKDKDGIYPAIGAIFSACYNVTGDIYGENMDRLLDITPGDVYNEVAVSRDKDKPMTGIKIKAYALNPNPSNTGIACIRVTGNPQNTRTSQTQYYGNDFLSAMDVEVDANIVTKDVVYSLPLVQINYAKNSKVRANIVGGGRSTVYPFQTDYNRDCTFEFSTPNASKASWRDRGGQSCRLVTSLNRNSNNAFSSIDYGLTLASFVSSVLTVSSAAAVGATSISVFGGTAAAILMNGSIVYNASGVAIGKIKKTTLITAGTTVVTNLSVTPLTAALAASDTITASLEQEGTKVSGSIHGFQRAVYLDRTRGVSLRDLTLGDSQRAHIYFNGDCRNIQIEKMKTFGANRSNDGIEPYAITCSGTDVLRSIKIRDCAIETDNLTTVVVGVYWPTTSNQSCSISGCSFGTFSASAISVAVSGLPSPYNMLSQYDNYAPAGTVLASGVPAGMYIGTRFVGESGATPTSGYWKIGDVIRTTSPVATGQEGWICVSSGSPGTWKGMGIISS